MGLRNRNGATKQEGVQVLGSSAAWSILPLTPHAARPHPQAPNSLTCVHKQVAGQDVATIAGSVTGALIHGSAQVKGEGSQGEA